MPSRFALPTGVNIFCGMGSKWPAAILTLLLVCLAPLVARSQGAASLSPARTSLAGADTLRVSIVTCWPGPEIYELEGHEAIRVAGRGQDMVWNYGTFDFAQPNFVGRFVAGLTDYKVVSYPFAWFLPEYVSRGSRVEEQVLALTGPEKELLLRRLQENARPEEATYRYNYVRDNCATRITAMVDSTAEAPLVFTDSVRFGTFRRAMRHYHRNYPWYQFGIDLVLGSGLDRPIDRRAETFAPVEMHDAFAHARFAGTGRQAVSETVVLNEGTPTAIQGPTPWPLTPLAVSIYMSLLTAGTCLLWWRRRKFARWWFSLYFGVCGLAGCLVAYLVFFSSHDSTSPNLMLVWLNPLQLLPALGVWFRSWRKPMAVFCVVDMLATGTLLLVWPWQAQSAQAAIWLMMAQSVALSLLYAIIAADKSYYNNMVDVPKHAKARKRTQEVSRKRYSPESRQR